MQHEDDTEVCYKATEEKNQIYEQKLAGFTEKLPDATSLAELTAAERKGKDACAVFTEGCRAQIETIGKFASKAPNSLVALNRDYIKVIFLFIIQKLDILIMPRFILSSLGIL